MKTANFAKKLFVVSLAVLLSVGLFPLSAFAGKVPILQINDLSEYQEVIDRLNVEYGTDMRFNTPQESEKYGVSLPDPRNLGTPEEFEKTLRAEVEPSLPIIRGAEQASARTAQQPGIQTEQRKTIDIIEDGHVVGSYGVSADSDLT